MAVTRQSSVVVFQGRNSEASMRHDEGQLCAQEDVTGGESSSNMVC